MNQSTKPAVVLASTSPFRRALLEKLGIEFAVDSPDIDESVQEAEKPVELVKRLAESKAKAVAETHPNALIIGSDQVAVCRGEILGKPGNRGNAIRQLSNASGQAVTFYTGLSLYNSAKQSAQTECDTFAVHFRDLSQTQIERYLDAEEPYNCAGSFKSEALGISLFEKLEGDDPNSLIGLPLIRLIRMFQQEGIQIP